MLHAGRAVGAEDAAELPGRVQSGGPAASQGSPSPFPPPPSASTQHCPSNKALWQQIMYNQAESLFQAFEDVAEELPVSQARVWQAGALCISVEAQRVVTSWMDGERRRSRTWRRSCPGC